MDKGWLAAFVLFFVFGGGFWVLRPVAAAIAKRIAGEHRRPAADPQERDALVAEVEQLRQDVTELQERVDFAERLLAKQREAPKIGRGE
ncbi:MAG: hypothetical protein AUH68_01685 [Gemmatimonadetes bacterium 13_1_40CM_4_69_5]|nr:MAG: hypothetical protein AUH68_01685 [Gemmatimonadetes bacterium 13_1_40CM_4_69_5]